LQCIKDLDCKKGIVVHGGVLSYNVNDRIQALPAKDMLLGDLSWLN